MTTQTSTIPERSDYERDVLALMTIPRKWVAFETDLFASKWFDYRYLHPVEATYLYAKAWEASWRRAFSRVIDDAKAPYVKCYKSHDVFDLKGTVLTGLWRGRQVADAIGMPYQAFCDLTFEETLRFWQRSHLPRPTQTYASRLIEPVVAKWEELQGARLYVGEHERFKNANYANTEIQNAHHEWLFDQAFRRGSCHSVLADFIWGRELLPEQKVLNRLGKERFEQVLRFK